MRHAVAVLLRSLTLVVIGMTITGIGIASPEHHQLGTPRLVLPGFTAPRGQQIQAGCVIIHREHKRYAALITIQRHGWQEISCVFQRTVSGRVVEQVGVQR